MQRYIATSVQRRDSNISPIWDMVDDGGGVLPSVFFELLREAVDEDGSPAYSASGRSSSRNGLVVGWTKLAGGKIRVATLSTELEGRRDLAMATAGGFLLYIAHGTQRSSQPTEVGARGRSNGCHTGLDNGRLVRSRRRDRGCGKRDGRATLRRRTVAALKRIGSNGPNI
jgi:hypothetical protein